MAWEWPLSFIAGSSIHRSLEARLAFLPLTALASLLLYQGTNAGLYYLVAMVVEFWAYSEGEVCILHGPFVPSQEANKITDYLCQTMDITPTHRSSRQCASLKKMSRPIYRRPFLFWERQVAL